MKQLIYKGFIVEKSYGQNDEAIFIGDTENPISDIIGDEINEKQVSVRYFISQTEKSKDELLEDSIKNLYGSVDAKYSDRYSEYTGYLWTDEDLNIGGHNLLDELRSNLGKYIYLEIDIQN